MGEVTRFGGVTRLCPLIQLPAPLGASLYTNVSRHGVTRHMLPHLSRAPHLHGNRLRNVKIDDYYRSEDAKMGTG